MVSCNSDSMPMREVEGTTKRDCTLQSELLIRIHGGSGVASCGLAYGGVETVGTDSTGATWWCIVLPWQLDVWVPTICIAPAVCVPARVNVRLVVPRQTWEHAGTWEPRCPQSEGVELQQHYRMWTPRGGETCFLREVQSDVKQCGLTAKGLGSDCCAPPNRAHMDGKQRKIWQHQHFHEFISRLFVRWSFFMMSYQLAQLYVLFLIGVPQSSASSFLCQPLLT